MEAYNTYNGDTYNGDTMEAYNGDTCHSILGNVYVTSEQGSPVVVLLRNLAGVSPSKLKG